MLRSMSNGGVVTLSSYSVINTQILGKIILQNYLKRKFIFIDGMVDF